MELENINLNCPLEDVSKIEARLHSIGVIFGEYDGGPSHMLKDIRVEDGIVFGTIKVMSTEKGNLLRDDISSCVFKPFYVERKGKKILACFNAERK